MAQKTTEKENIELMDWLGTLKDNYNIKKSEIEKGTGIKSGTMTGYYTYGNCNETDRRKIERYVRERRFYNGYTLKSAEEFGSLLKDIHKCFGNDFKQKDFGKYIGFSKSKMGRIFNGNQWEEDHSKGALPDVKSQYEILKAFYNACHDEFGVVIPRLRKVAELISNEYQDTLLCGAYCKLLEMLLSDKRNGFKGDEGLADLADQAGISIADLKDLIYDRYFPYDYEIKKKILYLIRDNYDFSGLEEYLRESEVRLINPGEFETGDDNPYEHFNSRILKGLDASFQKKKKEEDEWENETPYCYNLFRSLPPQLQEIILEFNMEFASPLPLFHTIEYANIPEEFATAIPEAEYRPGAYDLLYYFPIIRMFRELTSSQKEQIYESLYEKLKVPLPMFTYDVKPMYPHSCFCKVTADITAAEYLSIVNCYGLASMAPLISRYESSDEEKASLKDTVSTDFEKLRRIDEDVLREKLYWSFSDWNVYALLHIISLNGYDINLLIDSIYEMIKQNRKA